MKENINKSLILDRIKRLYGLNSNRELATFFGVSPQTISNWYLRNTIDYDLVLSKCKGVNLDLLIWGASEQQEDIIKEEITEPSELSIIANDQIYKAVKTLDGQESLFEYFCEKTNYQKESKLSYIIQDLIRDINQLAEENNIHRQFRIIYNKIKNGEIQKNNLIELFQGLILKDRIFIGILKPYLRELMAIDNMIFRQEEGDKMQDLSLFEL